MQNIFSIPITILQLNNINNNILINYAQSNYNENIKYINCKDTDFELQELNSVVLQQAKKFAFNYTNNEVNLKIKRVWSNVKVDNSIQTPHAHRDSFLSAVYYPLATDGELVIQSPFSHSHLSHLNPDLIKKYNEYSSDNFFVPAKTGMLVIFNAMLIHYVKPTTEKRISIAYDLIIDEQNETNFLRT